MFNIKKQERRKKGCEKEEEENCRKRIICCLSLQEKKNKINYRNKCMEGKRKITFYAINFCEWILISMLDVTCNNACNRLSLSMDIKTSGSIWMSCNAATSSSASRILCTASMPASSSAHSFSISDAVPIGTVMMAIKKNKWKEHIHKLINYAEKKNEYERKRDMKNMRRKKKNWNLNFFFIFLPASTSVQHNGSRLTPLAIAWTAPFNLRRALNRFNSSTVSFKCCLCSLSRSFKLIKM